MKLLHNEPLAPYTSLRAGGLARRLMVLEPHDNLQDAITQAQENGQVWILGYGTNSLISDHGLDGTVILDRVGRVEQITDTRFRADSGVNWDDLVQEAINRDRWGLEFASGIPGGVGAAVVGNIAAYGHKVSDTFVEATVFDTATAEISVWQNEDLGFDYRSSVLHRPENQRYVILNATFELSAYPTGELEYASALKTAEELGIVPDSLDNRRKIIMETRRRAGSLSSTNNSTGPWTAGSFFKNPIVSEDQVEAIIEHEETSINRKQIIRQSQIHTGSVTRVSAAHVLLAAGFHRGQTWGNVRLHPDHILKVENTGNAKAQEIYDVVQHILQTVKEKLDIDLEPEVRFLGTF